MVISVLMVCMASRNINVIRVMVIMVVRVGYYYGYYASGWLLYCFGLFGCPHCLTLLPQVVLSHDSLSTRHATLGIPPHMGSSGMSGQYACMVHKLILMTS